MKCPECENGKIVPAFHPMILGCPRCNGKGEIPDIQEEWIKKGAEYKRIRLEHGLGLRFGADQLGIQASVLSEYERGMRDPQEFEKLVEEKYNE